MRLQRLALGLTALTAIWLVGLGIHRLARVPTQPDILATETPANAASTQSFPDQAARQSRSPTQPSVILGSQISDVDRLLQGWTKSHHGAGPGYFKYDSDVRLVVHFRSGIAVGVAILSLRDRPISSARGIELSRLVGAAPDDLNYLSGELHEVYYGDI